MNEILIPALCVGAVGLLFGILLAVASIVFRVEGDERIPQIAELLPGANCGGCGYAGCEALAKAIAEGKASASSCAVAGKEAVMKIGEIMGEEVVFEKKFAYVHCAGTCEKAPDKFLYEGVRDCRAAANLLGGPKSCTYGCMGLGSCVSVCPYGAISIKDGIACVDKSLCRACGLCVKTCPKGIISIMSEKSHYAVECRSQDAGKDMKEKCSVGCIGCGLCQKACEAGAITVENHVAKINPALCTGCGACAEKCPRHIISEV